MGTVLKTLSKVGNVAKNAGKKAGSASEKATETALGSDGKSLFFLILSFVCIWLILDMFYGNKIIKKLVDSIFSDSDTVNNDAQSQGTFDSSSSSVVQKNNSTLAGATNNMSFPYQTGDEQRKSNINTQSKNNTTGSAGNSSASFPIQNKNNVSGKGTTTGGNSGSFPVN